jgi:hypothetical protein
LHGPRIIFAVTRNGVAIKDANVRNSVETGISYSNGFAEIEAAVSAGATLDELYKWEQNGYPLWFRAKIIAWSSLHKLIELHANDAVARKQAQEAKQKH